MAPVTGTGVVLHQQNPVFILKSPQTLGIAVDPRADSWLRFFPSTLTPKGALLALNLAAGFFLDPGSLLSQNESRRRSRRENPCVLPPPAPARCSLRPEAPPNATLISRRAPYLHGKREGQVCGRSCPEPTPRSVAGAGWSAGGCVLQPCIVLPS